MGRRYAQAVQRRVDAEVVAIVDPFSTKGEWPQYEDCATMVRAQQVDGAIIASPSSTHAAFARELLLAGVPILVEKPLALSSRDAASLVTLSERVGVPLLVGHIERFNPAVWAARDWLREGRLGDLIAIGTHRSGPPPRGNPGETNVISDLAIHDLDIVAWLFDRSPRALMTWVRPSDLEGLCSVEIRMDFGNASGIVRASWSNSERIRTLRIHGSAASLAIDYREQRVFAGTRELKTHQRDQLDSQLDNFLAVILGNEVPRAGGLVGWAAVELAERAIHSANEGIHARASAGCG